MKKCIKQQNLWTCFPCAVAMATNSTVQEIIDFCGHDGSAFDLESIYLGKRKGFTVFEMLKFVISKDYYTGAIFNFNSDNKFPENTVCFDFTLNLKSTNCLILVESFKLPGVSHTIYWDKENVYDPWPGHNNMKLSDYKVEMIIPINKVK
jgi:hypothetical protein